MWHKKTGEKPVAGADFSPDVFVQVGARNEN